MEYLCVYNILVGGFYTHTNAHTPSYILLYTTRLLGKMDAAAMGWQRGSVGGKIGGKSTVSHPVLAKLNQYNVIQIKI